MPSAVLNRHDIFESHRQLVSFGAEDIRPLQDRILVRDIPDDEKVGLIFIPPTAAERGAGKQGLLRFGVVVAVGAGDMLPGGRAPMYCQVGDTVLYDRRREAELYINGERHSLVHEEQSVYGILDNRLGGVHGEAARNDGRGASEAEARQWEAVRSRGALGRGQWSR